MIIGFLTIFIVVIGLLAYNSIDKAQTKSSSPTPSPLTVGDIPPSKPNNPSNLPLVTNYTITIPKFYNGEDIPQYKVFMNFIAPSPSLQGEENWTIANYTINRVPFLFTTWAKNSSTYSDSYTIAEILPAVFNGTTIDVKINVYGYNGFNVQLVDSKEWNVTEFIYT